MSEYVCTGLLVMAKEERSLLNLQAQFKARTVQRTYQSITLGCPSPAAGQVSSNIGRDSADRKKMAAFTFGSSRCKPCLVFCEIIFCDFNIYQHFEEWAIGYRSDEVYFGIFKI